MRSAVIISALLGVVLVAIMTPKTGAQDLSDLVGGLTGNSLVEAITAKIVGLYRTGEVVLLNHVCSFQVKPTLRKFQLYFKSAFWCPGWTPIKGEYVGRSNSNAVNNAVRDFVEKAFARGLITEKSANEWLNQ